MFMTANTCRATCCAHAIGNIIENWPGDEKIRTQTLTLGLARQARGSRISTMASRAISMIAATTGFGNAEFNFAKDIQTTGKDLLGSVSGGLEGTKPEFTLGADEAF
jgi:hypothetical protein